MENMLEALKKYFVETPREKVLEDWAKTKEATKGIKSPTIGEFLDYNKSYTNFLQSLSPEQKEEWFNPTTKFKHKFRVLTTEEVMLDRSSAYEFLNFDNPEIKEDLKNYKGC